MSLQGCSYVMSAFSLTHKNQSEFLPSGLFNFGGKADWRVKQQSNWSYWLIIDKFGGNQPCKARLEFGERKNEEKKNKNTGHVHKAKLGRYHDINEYRDTNLETILISERFGFNRSDISRYIVTSIKYRNIAMYFLAETSCTPYVWSKTSRIGH